MPCLTIPWHCSELPSQHGCTRSACPPAMSASPAICVPAEEGVWVDVASANVMTLAGLLAQAAEPSAVGAGAHYAGLLGGVRAASWGIQSLAWPAPACPSSIILQLREAALPAKCPPACPPACLPCTPSRLPADSPRTGASEEEEDDGWMGRLQRYILGRGEGEAEGEAEEFAPTQARASPLLPLQLHEWQPGRQAGPTCDACPHLLRPALPCAKICPLIWPSLLPAGLLCAGAHCWQAAAAADLAGSGGGEVAANAAAAPGAASAAARGRGRAAAGPQTSAAGTAATSSSGGGGGRQQQRPAVAACLRPDLSAAAA